VNAVGWLRRSLFRKLFVAFLVLVFGALLTSSLVDLLFTYQGNQAALKRLQTKETVTAAASIRQFLDDIEAQITGAVRPLWSMGADDLEQRQDAYFGLLRVAPAISQVSYLDASGNRLLKLSRVTVNEAAGPAERYEQEASERAGADEPYRSRVDFLDDSEPHAWIGIRDHGPGGVTVAKINLTFIRDVISKIEVGRAGVAYVVDQEGRLLAYPDISPVLQGTNLRDWPQVQAALTSEPAASSAGEPLVGRSLDGKEVVSYYQAVEPLGWWVFVEWPSAEAWEPVYAAAARTAVLLAVGLTLSVLASLLVTRKLVHPIRTLQQAAVRIDPTLDPRALEQRIDVSTGDELEALAREFNRMIERLQESYTSLERRVAERTSELARALERQTAISEVLRLITRSPTERRAVLDAVAQNAAQLCEASGASIWLRDGDDTLRRSAGYGSFASEVGAERLIGPDWITGRAMVEARTVHEPDLTALSEQEYRRSERRFRHRYRGALSTPILRDGEPVGVISVGRKQAKAFSGHQIELLETFADQIVIALELTRLFDELTDLNRTLDERVRRQVEELERIGRLRQFFSPQVADLILSSGGEERLQKKDWRQVTVVFCDLRGYTAFSNKAPQDTLDVLREYHTALGEVIFSYEGTLERFAGDGLMVFFNDPVPCENPQERAVRMAAEMRERMTGLTEKWRNELEADLGFGVGIDHGYASTGRIGSKLRFDYAAIGKPTNRAARLCSQAGDHEIRITQRVYAAVTQLVEAELLGEVEVKGFPEPVRVYNVLGLK
jgi:class 3 adenylate cyclase/HAMP domain-containing protein